MRATNHEYDNPSYKMASTDVYFSQNVGFFHRTVGEYFNDPERVAIIKRRLNQDFDVTEASRRLCLAEFKFARTMRDYFKPQGTRQTSLVGTFSTFICSLRDDESTGATLRLLQEFETVLEHHRREPFTFPGETRQNYGTIKWGQDME